MDEPGAPPTATVNAGLAGKRLAFLYNHDETHQVAHTAPLISTLVKAAPSLTVDVLVSSEAQREAVTPYLDPAAPPAAVHRLRPGRAARVAQQALGGLAPLSRIGVLANNLDLLASYDALVVPETTTTLLKTRFKRDKPAIIFLPHGAGDRSIGFSPEIAHCDFVLLSGEKVRRRMFEAGIIRPDNHAVIGYPKFDILRTPPPPPLFGDDRPVVLYNPHFDPKLSSWYRWGEAVLDYFAGQTRYNLVFAPHVMLFRRALHASVEHRRIALRGKIRRRFFDHPHIRIDTGSEKSVDMTYTRGADIYLGDVSSQIYEFIAQPRPAVFLNAHHSDWRNNPNYAHWRLGPVVEAVGDLDAALETAQTDQHYRDAQAFAFEDTFSVDDSRSAADRAASAIVEFLETLPTRR